MDDEGGDWFADAGDEAPKVEEKVDAPKEAPPSDAPPAATEGAAEAAPAAAEPAQESTLDEFLDPDKLLVFKHWIRPKFLQYNYLYNYRKNYYDDVIDYLDKRQRGYSRDVPRAQTWPERVLRAQGKNRDEYFKKLAEDTKLISKTQLSGAFFHYHSKQYINRRYSSLLY